MPRRDRPEPLSPRAAARLRAPRRGYVPTARELGPSGAVLRGPLPVRGGPDVDVGLGADADVGADVDAGVDQDVAPHAGRLPDERVGATLVPTLPDDDDPWRRRSRPAGADTEGVGVRGWVRLPSSFVGARWDPGRLAVVGIAVVVAVAVALFGLRVAWAANDGTVLAPGGGSRAGPTGLSAGAAPVGAGPTATPTASPTSEPTSGPGAASGHVVVHVVGEVRSPGLRRLVPGSRVADALEASGGATKAADLARVNLARVLVDGEQVVVPAPGDPDPPGPPGAPAPGGTGGSTPSGGGAAVSINTADLAGLDTLPGVGPVLAQRILDWRTEHGRFTSVDELGEVSGIGEKLLERLRPLVTL